jgi:hypothetical protein
MSIRLGGRFRVEPAPQRDYDIAIVMIWLVAIVAIATVFAMGMR